MTQPPSFSSEQWYNRLIAQPALWASLLVFVLVINALGHEITLYNNVAERYLLHTQNLAELTHVCLANSNTPVSANTQTCLQHISDHTVSSIALLERSNLAEVASAGSGAKFLPATIAHLDGVDLTDDRFMLVRDEALPATMLAGIAAVPQSDWLLVAQDPFRELISLRAVPRFSLISGTISSIVAAILLVLMVVNIVVPLRRLSNQMRAIGTENPPPPAEPEVLSGLDVIARLNYSQKLVSQRMRRYQVSLQQYATRVTNVRENERKRLSHDLHDETMQGIVAVGQRLQIAQRLLQREAYADAAERLQQASNVNRITMEELRRTIRALRPVNLVGAGLLEALAGMTTELTNNHHIDATFDVQNDPRPIDPDIELAIFRLTQEALSNARRHSQADHVSVLLIYDVEHVVLKIDDDGVGFNQPEDTDILAVHGHYGLVGMQERVIAVGGEFEMNSAEGQGTHYLIRLPYHAQHEHDAQEHTDEVPSSTQDSSR
ncbi:MAG: sensor histidine kinase [Chloroflexi bacterium]|nr:sensor histidine kinase [Chloroflexota bacterium]